MTERAVTVFRARDDLTELDATVHNGGFWRLVPESVPRVYDPITRTLLEDVERGLRRLIS